MPSINLGVDFAKAEEESSIKPLPAGNYEFSVKSAEQVEAGENSKTPGRPMIKWVLTTVNASDQAQNNRNIFYYTPLPWENPNTGEFDNSAIGLLVNLCKGVGVTWDGSSLDTDVVVGQTGMMELIVEKYKDQDNNKINKIHPKP